MNITDIKIRKTYGQGRLRALVSITLDNEFAIHDIKIIDGPQRYFVAMASRRDEKGIFRDICHPISATSRSELETVILDKYWELINKEESAILPQNLPFENDVNID